MKSVAAFVVPCCCVAVAGVKKEIALRCTIYVCRAGVVLMRLNM